MPDTETNYTWPADYNGPTDPQYTTILNSQTRSQYGLPEEFLPQETAYLVQRYGQDWYDQFNSYIEAGVNHNAAMVYAHQALDTGMYTGQSPSNGNGAISPALSPPMYPGLQTAYGNWLQSFFTNGQLNSAPGYPGQLSPGLNNTMLPGIFSQYNQGNPSTGYMQGILGNLGIGQTSPIAQQLMNWGGTGGPGNQGLSNLMQFGVASEGSGRPLANLAYGQPTGASAYLLNYINGSGGASAYKAPMIPNAPRQRFA